MKPSLTISMRATLLLLCICLVMLVLSMWTMPNAWSQTTKSLDAPLRYTVKVVSPLYGNVSETRAIASGAADDFIWKKEPPAGAVPVDPRCPQIDDMLLDANHAMLQQIKVRLAPVVGLNRMASVQLIFSAHTPQGHFSHSSAMHHLDKGVTIKCPFDRVHQEFVHFDMPLNGQPKKIELTDGTKIVVSAKP